jgi:hypothetical protein
LSSQTHKAKDNQIFTGIMTHDDMEKAVGDAIASFAEYTILARSDPNLVANGKIYGVFFPEEFPSQVRMYILVYITVYIYMKQSL